MRFSPTEIIDALEAAGPDGIAPRCFVWIEPLELESDDRAGFGFWSGAQTVEIEVVAARTGATVTRTYVGRGALVEIGRLKLTSTLRVRNWSFVLNPLDPAVQLMLHGHNCFRAPVEYHRVPLSMETRRPVAAPRPRFFGYVDRIDAPRAAAGDEARQSIDCVSRTVDLTVTNPAKRSAADSAHSRYADTIHKRKVGWGETVSGDGS